MQIGIIIGILCLILFGLNYYFHFYRNKKALILLLNLNKLQHIINMEILKNCKTNKDIENYEKIKLKYMENFSSYNNILYSFKKICLESYLSIEEINYINELKIKYLDS